MKSEVKSVKQYLEELPEERKGPFNKLRQTILANLPEGYREEMSYGMIGYVVPHSIYPEGYHCDPKLPVPFISIASQKQNIAFYHMALYADRELLDWFTREYPKHSDLKLDMGKSCIRFRYPNKIPFELIGELVRKLSVDRWIGLYEKYVKK